MPAKTPRLGSQWEQLAALHLLCLGQWRVAGRRVSAYWGGVGVPWGQGAAGTWLVTGEASNLVVPSRTLSCTWGRWYQSVTWVRWFMGTLVVPGSGSTKVVPRGGGNLGKHTLL